MEEKEFDYINVIPLVDVMLVLLTIVLTTSSFIATGRIPVELPRASRSRRRGPENPDHRDRSPGPGLFQYPVRVFTGFS